MSSNSSFANQNEALLKQIEGQKSRIDEQDNQIKVLKEGGESTHRLLSEQVTHLTAKIEPLMSSVSTLQATESEQRQKISMISTDLQLKSQECSEQEKEIANLR